MATVDAPRTSRKGEPAWDIAQLFPEQGAWSEEEYLTLTNSTNHRCRGCCVRRRRSGRRLML